MAHRHGRRRLSHRDSSPLTQDPQDVMSTAMRLQWNIRVLQRHDPQITDIVDQFTYCVLYRFEEEQWVKKGVEGSMFIYTRTDPPRHGICILNREGVGNYVLPLRKGDDMEVTDNYIIYRPADVPRDRYEDYIGIWTADLGERARLGEFLTKIKNHVAKTDVPYTPVLLHMPATEPHPPPLTLQASQTPVPEGSNRTQKQKGRRLSNAGNYSQSPQPTTTEPAYVNPTQTIESLFAKIAVPAGEPPRPGPTVSGASAQPSIVSLSSTTVNITHAERAGAPTEELRGQSLLQSIFASVAPSNSAPSPAPPPIPTATIDISAGSNHNATQPSQPDLLHKLFAGLQPAPQTPSPRPASTSSQPSSVFPPATPFVEDDDSPQTSPRRPAQSTATKQLGKQTATPSTPPPRSQRPVQPRERELVPYNMDMPDGTQIVSPWANKALEREAPPSPSQLPRPKAVRERKGRHQSQQSIGSSSKAKAQYIPTNNGHQFQPKIDKDAVAQATANVMANKVPAGLSRDDFVQQLLTFIHQTGDFVDLVYAEYSKRSNN